MNSTKCALLKDKYAAQREPHLIPMEEFLDGNDDIGSLGCNHLDHPGIDAFRNAFRSLLGRNDVEAIYAHISELDPGEDSWRFTDTIYVVGTIQAKELETILSSLEPDDIGDALDFGIPPSITKKHHLPSIAIWWD